MNLIDLDLMPAILEIVLLALLTTVLLTDLWINDENRYLTYLTSLGTVIIVAITQLAVQEQGNTLAFHGMYIAGGMSRLFKSVLYGLTFGLFIYSKPYNQVRGIFKGELYTPSLFALLGMSVTVGAAHFLAAYTGLELLSLPLYAMIALHRDSGRFAEATLKYFVLGALTSGLLFYDISMVYGATGSLEFVTVLAPSYSELASEWLLKLGLAFTVVAIAFKLGAVPFHMWMSDMYHGVLTPVVVFVSTVPKIAAVVFTPRILVTGLGAVYHDWSQVLAVLAVASLLINNLAAIMQANVERMLVYSTISHMGFIPLVFIAGAAGFVASLYYTITYALTATVGFGILMVLPTDNIECEKIRDLVGPNQRHAWFALPTLLVMFSMAGTPPLMGFYTKFGVIKTLLSVSTAQNVAMTGSTYIILAVFAVMMSLIGAFHYLCVVKVMYSDEATHDQPIGSNYVAKFFLSVNTLLLILWGIMPQTVIDWCVRVLEDTL